MKVNAIKVGYLKANCYIIENEFNEVLVVDPGAEFKKIDSLLEGKKVVGVLKTHSHPDHIGAIKPILKKYNVLCNSFNYDNFSFEVIKTPGHYKDSLSFYFPKEKMMFTGDFLFKGTFGRVDLPGSNPSDMKKSLIDIKKYPEDTLIYPGHGHFTILKDELNNIDYFINYYFGNL